MAKYVLLQGIIAENYGQRFFTMTDNRDPEIMENGVRAYETIGHADTIKEAQIKLYGRSYTDRDD